MSLSKRNYIAVAEVIRTARTKRDIIDGLEDYFAGDNPRFDAKRFRDYIERQA